MPSRSGWCAADTETPEKDHYVDYPQTPAVTLSDGRSPSKHRDGSRRRGIMRTLRARLSAMVFLVSSGAVWGAGEVLAQLPPPLSAVPVPRPSNLSDFIRDEGAARMLGKALFWDMQVGSDGVQACATCHFRAGADPRKKNQISPGLLRVLFQLDEDGNPAVFPNGDLSFDGQGPNYTLRRRTSPSGSWLDPRNRESAVVVGHRTTLCPRRACTSRSSARAATPRSIPRASTSDRVAGAPTCAASSRATRRR